MLLKPSVCALTLACIIFFVTPAFAGHGDGEEEHEVDPKSGEFWGDIIAIFFLVLLSGIVAGLTLGLMSLDTTNLQILEIAGTPQQKYHASRIIPIRKNGHILLTTLLLTNTVLNETLPILFDGIFSQGFISVVVSTALLVMFSEIIPQAIFSKHGLAIGALFAYPVRILIAVWFVISWPISKFLDYLLGTHTGFTYGVAEFAALIGLHDMSRYPEGTLKHEIVNVMQNVLEMQEKQAGHMVTSVNNMLFLKSDTALTASKIDQYQCNGYAYIFVYDQQSIEDDYHIIGVLEIKSLEERDLNQPVGKMKMQSYLTASSRESIIDVMNQLISRNIKEHVVLIYRTNQDVKAIKNEQIAGAHEIASIRSKALKTHQRSFNCWIRRLIGHECHVCLNLLAPATNIEEKDVGEDGTISSNPTTIDVALESGLLGMITLADILNQLSRKNLPLEINSQFINNKLAQQPSVTVGTKALNN